MYTGVSFIDKKLGALQKDTITTIYGPPGCGKTTFSMLYANDCVRNGKKVIFVDTEGGFSVERLRQINPEINLEDISVLKPTNFEEQSQYIESLNQRITKSVGLIIIDSLVMLYRLKLGDQPRKINMKLAEQLMLLNEIGRKYNIPIILTNQIYKLFDSEKEKMVGGSIIEYWSKTIIKLEKKEDVKRILLEKHKNIKAGFIGNYKIEEKGFEETRGFM